MLSMKKIAIAMLALGGHSVFAGTMGSVCTQDTVTVPCTSSGWGFGIQALYLQPSYSIGSFLQHSNNAETVYTYINPKYNWGWGFKLDGSYHFSSMNDLNLSWTHYHSTNSQVLSNGSLGSNFFDVFTDSTIYANIVASVKPEWDAVNLEFGQPMHFGEWNNLRIHGGVQYANIRTTSANTVVSKDMANNPVIDSWYDITGTSNNMQYWGVGPRLGMDLHYGIGNGWNLYANGATALLVGTQKFNTAAVGTTTNNLNNDSFPFPASYPPMSPISFVQTGSRTAIVPELELKVGASYLYTMSQGNLSLDVGWMLVNYFNALQTSIGAPSTYFGFNNSSNPTIKTGFGVQGPYLGLNWVGNVV